MPVETIDFTEGVFDELKKVFSAQNKFVGFQFTNPELIHDYESYLKEIQEPQWWANDGFRTMKSAINSIVIVDLPAVIEGKQPSETRPYFYVLDVQRVERISIVRNKIEYIIFCDGHNENVVYAFDDMMYRTYARQNGNIFVLVSESPHGLGYVPAATFWSTPYTRRSKIQKAGPISNSLSKLDWLLFMYTSTKHSELHAGFPVEVVYEQRCDYKDAEGNSCEGGQVRKTVRTGIGTMDVAAQVVYEECPTCKNKRILGAGRVLTAPAMASKDDVDLIQGMNRIGADVDSLGYLLKRIDGLETSIAINMAGFTEEDVKEAMNKEQVRARFQSQHTVLMEVKENFEVIMKFVLETIARLKYGAAFISATVNLGDKFFIHSLESLQQELEKARANGFPVYEIANQINLIIATKYKENPAMLERNRTLSAIEPYAIYTIEQLITLNEKVGLVENLVRLKIDFEAYISRFEREYLPIGQFMQFSPFETKVEMIRAKLLDYVDEDYPEQEPPAAPDPTLPPAGNGGAPPLNPGVPSVPPAA